MGTCQRRRLIPVLMAIGSLLASLPAVAWTSDQMKRLRAGEVVVDSQRQPRGGIVDAAILVPAPPRLVYTLLADPTQAPRYSPEITGVQILEDHGTHKRVRMHVQQMGLIDEANETASTFRPYEQISWEQTKGRFAHQSGSWKISGCDNGTLLSYHLDIDVGTSLPGIIVEMFLRTTVPNLLRNVRKQF